MQYFQDFDQYIWDTTKPVYCWKQRNMLLMDIKFYYLNKLIGQKLALINMWGIITRILKCNTIIYDELTLKPRTKPNFVNTNSIGYRKFLKLFKLNRYPNLKCCTFSSTLIKLLHEILELIFHHKCTILPLLSLF